MEALIIISCNLLKGDTCEANTKCVLSKTQSLGPFWERCKSLFNISAADGFRNVDSTNRYYGGTNVQGSRIIFVNGICVCISF